MTVNNEYFKEFSCGGRSQCIYNNFDQYIEERRWYQHDIDQIVYSTSFRKMQRKHQLISEKDPRCRSRMVHTLEVARIAKEISEKLNLDTELTEAISLSHDLGNSAYGSVSNRILSFKTGNIFKHEEASALILKRIGQKVIKNKDIKGKLILNLKKGRKDLTYMELQRYFPYEFEMYAFNNEYYYTCICAEILDGVMKHGTANTSYTLEGQVVNFADNIAYLSQDIDDLIAIGILGKNEIDDFTSKTYGDLEVPGGLSYKWDDINQDLKDVDLKHVFSASSSERIGTLIKRYVNYNLNHASKLSTINSPVLNKSIPVLQIDKGLQIVIDYLWNFTENFYNHNLIRTYNQIVDCKINVLWDILYNSDFSKQNKSCCSFFESLENPCFKDFFIQQKFDNTQIELWKSAFFVSSLSCDEIDLILDLYQQRDFTFDLDI